MCSLPWQWWQRGRYHDGSGYGKCGVALRLFGVAASFWLWQGCFSGDGLWAKSMNAILRMKLATPEAKVQKP